MAYGQVFTLEASEARAPHSRYTSNSTRDMYSRVDRSRTAQSVKGAQGARLDFGMHEHRLEFGIAERTRPAQHTRAHPRSSSLLLCAVWSPRQCFGESGLLENEPTAPAEQAHMFWHLGHAHGGRVGGKTVTDGLLRCTQYVRHTACQSSTEGGGLLSILTNSVVCL